MTLKAVALWFARMSGESRSPDIYLLFAISHCSVLLTQTYCEPGPLVELGLQELSAPMSLPICTEILNIFVNF